MSPEQPLQITLPTEFEQVHHDALIAFLTDNRRLNSETWRHLYVGIDLLSRAEVISGNSRRTFKQTYADLIDKPLSNSFIEQLLKTKNVLTESPKISATFARKITPLLQENGLLSREVPTSVLLQGYCLYWWQSFARGYAFEIFIKRDLQNSGIQFQMHDLMNEEDRYSPADLIVQNLLGDIKTSTYFLQDQWQGSLRNDFYITRVYEKGHERTLVVFQKPHAWQAIGGIETIRGTFLNILDLLPAAVELERHGTILIVIDYETWKRLVSQLQSGERA